LATGPTNYCIIKNVILSKNFIMSQFFITGEELRNTFF